MLKNSRIRRQKSAVLMEHTHLTNPHSAGEGHADITFRHARRHGGRRSRKSGPLRSPNTIARRPEEPLPCPRLDPIDSVNQEQFLASGEGDGCAVRSAAALISHRTVFLGSHSRRLVAMEFRVFAPPGLALQADTILPDLAGPEGALGDNAIELDGRIRAPSKQCRQHEFRHEGIEN
jgi:hypothetical protein